ncbi:hypothetical protein GEV43_18545 [Actinomadura sp. J1-007]|nr:hypothetical protein [Actinomadura sp. J1-007]
MADEPSAAPPAPAESPGRGRRAAKKERRAEAKAAKKRGKAPEPPAPPVPADPAQRRRARSAERQRAQAEVKRSRAAQRRSQTATPEAKALRQHRSALLIMVITLGLLIAAVAVTGGMIAASMRTRPVTLAAPLHVYPVTQSVPGQCPAGTQGITGQAAGGVTCYQLAQGIAIRKVADLRVQKSRVTSGNYDVAVTLRHVDRKAFAELTRATVGRDLAFVVGSRLVTLPRVDMPILDGKVVVTGPQTKGDANKLVHALKGK